MDPRPSTALAALATFALLAFQGCGGDGSKKETLKQIAGEQGAPIVCEKEAPRLCAMQDMEELRDFIPRNMKQLCGGTKSGTHGGLLLSYCKEDCNGGGAADHTVEKMTVCLAETVVRNQVIEWGHSAKKNERGYLLDEKHTPCQYFVDRACDFDEGYKQYCGLPEPAEGQAAVATTPQRDELVTVCLDSCTAKVDLAGCMMEEFKDKLEAAGIPNAGQTVNENELHFMQKVEASVLSEAWGTPVPHFPKHNNDILARHAKAHCVGAAGKCSDEELDAALLRLKGVAGTVPDTHSMMTGLDARVHDRAVNAQALSEVLSKHDAGGLEAYDVETDFAAHEITKQVIEAGVLLPVNKAQTVKLKKELTKPVTAENGGLVELGATPGEILEGLVDLGERVGRIEPLGAHESVVKPSHHHHAHQASHRESHREAAHHREYAHDRAAWVVGPHGHAHRGRALAPDDVME